jgi:hypothetical protein
MKSSNKKIFVNLGQLKITHLLCCAANRTAQRISIYASRFGYLRALHLSNFEQSLNQNFFNIVNLNDFSSGYDCLSLTFINPIDYFSKNNYLTEHRFPLSIQIPIAKEHKRYPIICRWICLYEEAHRIDKKKDKRTSK